MRASIHWLASLGVATFLAVPAAKAASVQSVCSSSGVAELPGPTQAFATDPPGGVQRCISTQGAVSSSISSSGPPGFVGSFFWDTGSSISADTAAGVRFSGFAQATFNSLPPSFGLGAVAATSGSFLDTLTISAPGVSGSGVLVIPLQVTGSVSAAGTFTGGGVSHTGELTYRFLSSGLTAFGSAQGTIGLTTGAETLVCGPAACTVAPIAFNETRVLMLPFTFDEQFVLRGDFGIDASFFLGAPPGSPGFLSGSATADFSHTLTLGPATVTDALGNPIAGVTIASDIDYLAGTPVPEPSVATLLAGGLIGAAAARRRLRR